MKNLETGKPKKGEEWWDRGMSWAETQLSADPRQVGRLGG